MDPAPDFDLLDAEELGALLRPLRAGERIELPALGRSMWPALRSGDTVVLEPVGAPRPGEILLALVNGRAVVHRLLRVEHGRYLLKGDFNRSCDPEVTREELLGRVVALLRGGKRTRLDAGASRIYGLLLARASPATGALADHSRPLRRLAIRAAVGPLGPVTRRVAPLEAPVARLPPTFLRAYLTRAAANGEWVTAARARALAEALPRGAAALFGALGPGGRLVATAECSSRAIGEGLLPGSWLRSVWVSPLYRRRGLAGELVDAALAFAREARLGELSLVVAPENLEALRLYQRRGFVRGARSAEAERVIAEAGLYPGPRHVVSWRPPG